MKTLSFDATVKTLLNDESSYTGILDAAGLPSRENEFYLCVSEPNIEQGWILHLSVVVGQFSALMATILPCLKEYMVAFKIVKNTMLHNAFNNGEYGHAKVGKIVTIFMEENAVILPLSRMLVEMTNSFFGPKITTDFRIGNIVYARYGAFRPHIEKDGYGNLDRLIMDSRGLWLKDKYRLPPVLPKGIINPFLDLMERAPQTRNVNPLKGIYFLGDALKSDFRGGVLEAYFMGENGKKRRCVVKRAKKGMQADEAGRDMKVRLFWQYKLTEELAHLLPIPAIIDYWDEGEQAFLVMEYIEGRDLLKVCYDIMGTRPWFRLSAEDQYKVMAYFLKIIDILETLHQNGYVHRDVTGTNFLVKADGEIALIDLELMYKEGAENRPFKGGTEGFMSPSQEQDLIPDFKDDIYAFGALMTACITGLSLTRLGTANKSDLSHKLQFLIRNNGLVDLIFGCLDEKPELRPDWRELRFLIYKILNDQSELEDLGNLHYENRQIAEIVSKGINALGQELMVDNGLWFSYIDNKYDSEVYPLYNKYVFTAMHRGVGGVLYLLAKAKRSGFDLTVVHQNIQYGWNFIIRELSAEIDKLAPGLHFGSTGLAILLAQYHDEDNSPVAGEGMKWIRKCLFKDNNQRNIIHGSAGDVLAILQGMDYTDCDEYKDSLDINVGHLIRAQLPSGAWKKEADKKNREEVVNGFGYGVAGIVYVLLEYGYRYDHPEAIAAARRGLDYLDNARAIESDFWEWKNSDLDPERGVWWCHGGPGIALTYLKAYEFTKEDRYLLIAEDALRRHPEEFVYWNLSQCHGISGLGELYLEAFRITRSPEWWNRATWIADLLCTLKFQLSSESVYWLVEKQHFATADLMLGCSGILHFLIRYMYPDEVFFPLLPESMKMLPL